MKAETTSALVERRRLRVRGAVQGVGFRPFAHRLAREMGIGGEVQNTGQGVTLEIEGPPERLDRFAERLVATLPSPGRIVELATEALAPRGESTFRIVASAAGRALAFVLPDQATCAACLAELWDPHNRRHRHPFITCTACGPRYTILGRLPYDRPNTTMARFALCRACQAEYDDPGSRRHHAETIACPACGPTLRLLDGRGGGIAERQSALEDAVARLRQGGIVAVKGIGGFQLLVDARDEDAVARLRQRKARTHKPFAVMVPDLAAAQALCVLSPAETAALGGPPAPIVLARRRAGGAVGIAPSVAPELPDLGLFLPCSPLHHLLLQAVAAPLVATSGNLAEEPLCTDEGEAVERLGGIADAFLVHDRPIARACDDSVVRVMAGRPVVLRRARGYAPGPVGHAGAMPGAGSAGALLATGGHLKNTVAVSLGGEVIVSPHVGDLDSPAARAHQARLAQDLLDLHPQRIAQVVVDRHPDYGSRLFGERLARENGAGLVEIQHHAAHLWGCLLDNQARPPCLGVVWDGLGLGPGGALWGGEFLRAGAGGVKRVAHLRTFALPGGERSSRDARLPALGLLWEILGQEAFARTALAPIAALSAGERTGFAQVLAAGRHVPGTSSAGRLFDAVAALLGVALRSQYEGHAACALEAAARRHPDRAAPYPMKLVPSDPLVLDWEPMIRALLDDLDAGEAVSVLAARFHAGLVAGIVAVARQVGLARVALTGGCFQNPTLLEGAVRALVEAGHEPLWHREIPPNDGGLAAGQLFAAAEALPCV